MAILAPEMDPLLAAEMLPRLADLAMRGAVTAALRAGRHPTVRALVDDALVRFERCVQAKARDGVRPALLFTQRDRILGAMRAFLSARSAARLFALLPRNVIAAGKAAAPFDAIVRGRDGRAHAVVLRAVPRDGGRLELFRRIRAAATLWRSERLASVVVFDLNGSAARVLRVSNSAGVKAA